MASLFDLILPKGKGKAGGKAYPPRFNPQQPELAAPAYRQHLSDLFSTRQSNDSRSLLNDLVNHDSDVSSAVHSYLTIAGSSSPVIYAYDTENQLDPEGIKLAWQHLALMTNTFDYTIGYSAKSTLDSLITDLRYMLLLRGSVAAEVILNKQYIPDELRIIDTSTVLWRQTKPGVYAPYQKPQGSNDEIDLNVPTFFHSTFHQNPTDVYTFSPFVSAINTIAARQDVINELYRIMKFVGYPRLDITVLEDILVRNVPPAFRSDPEKSREFVNAELNRVRVAVSNLNSNQAFVHSNAVEAKIINDKNPGAGIQIQSVIDVLDSQNQAALKVMPAVVGKGSNGQTSSTESRLFAMSADALNRSIADLLTKSLTLAVRLTGYTGLVKVVFPPVELRPTLELEPQKTMKAARLKEDLSLGLITDDEYHLEMYGRPRPDSAPELSGTNFLQPNTGAASVDAEGVTPNTDSLGRSMAPEGGTKQARSNTVKSGSPSKSGASKSGSSSRTA